MEPKIAELATGPGAFLVDLSKELPTVSQLDGFDISDDAFLSKHELPEKVSLSVSDAKQPAAPELHDKYDAVCIRFLNIALMPDDWKAVARHAWQLLKPGGALQWIEGDLLQLMTIVRSAPGSKTTALERGSSQALSKLDRLRWFIPNLSDVLAEAGFENIRHEISSSDRVSENRKRMGRLVVGAFDSILKKQANSEVEGTLTEDEVEKLEREMLDEVEGGAYPRTDMHQFIAWKAM